MVLIVKEESPMTKKLAVFDLDGTLSRTELFSVPAAQEMERLLGYPVQEASHIIASFGTNYKDTMDAIFPAGIKRLMISIYPWRGNTGKVSGPRHALRWYSGSYGPPSRHRVRNGSLLQFQHPLYQNVCQCHWLEGQNGLSSGTGGWNGSQGPKPGQAFKRGFSGKAVMVGDTLLDRQAAVDNQIPFIGCVYGFRPYEMEQVEHTAAHASELPRLIEGLLGE